MDIVISTLLLCWSVTVVDAVGGAVWMIFMILKVNRRLDFNFFLTT